ncbi:MAG: hypothetical protein JXA13_11580 [Anaerolineales bacterium]|nr:hypothetical protein [Anaerolineales bacterium]
MKVFRDENSLRLWFSRLLIAAVAGWNLQVAFAFVFDPGLFVSSFQLSGVPGETAVRGVGVLFVMWNLPYLAALWHPLRYALALKLALGMQLLGLVGESFILWTLPGEYVLLQTSIWRFIAFDGSGLVLLFLAYSLIRKDMK